MFLKELEISGFKSFANKTVIRFEHSVTAVVGPNGCGKSNILDAVKWVLGERSVKAIRGENKEDVIFSGTDQRKAVNYAEVQITFDNKSRLFSLERDEVKIGRRLYRDGQNQYLLSDQRVTLKEIENLLMDTGVGKSSYSFMEQGRMDMILSSKPEERRSIFEEAAGISRFKSQRHEAERNLENARLNMTRVEDILRELERELKIKTSQAEKTKKYNTLKESMQKHDLKIRLLTIEELGNQLKDKDQKLRKRLSQQEKLKQKSIQAEEKIQQSHSQQQQIQEQLHQKNITNQVSREKISQSEIQIKKLQGSIIERQAQFKHLDEQTVRIEKRIKELKENLHEQSQLSLLLSGQRQEIEENQQKNKTELHDLEKNIKGNQENMKKSLVGLEKLKQALRGEREAQEKAVLELLTALKQEKDMYLAYSAKQEEKKKQLQIRLLELQNLIEAGNLSKISNETSPINLSRELDSISTLSPGLRTLLFEKGGIHSKKEDLDEKINIREKEIAHTDEDIIKLRKAIAKDQEMHGSESRRRETLIGELNTSNVQIKNVSERESTYKNQLKAEETNYQFLNQQRKNTEQEILAANEAIRKTQESIRQLTSGIEKEVSQIQSLETKREKQREKHTDLEKDLRTNQEKIETEYSAINELEIALGTLLAARESQVQDIFNDYNMTLDEVRERIGKARIQLTAEKERLSILKQEIQKLGPVNPLAIDEVAEVKTLYDHNDKQLTDLKQARGDILAVIEDIEKRSETQFLESFAEIEKNFAVVFKKLFKGGDIKLRLVEPDKPLESGIDISVQPPGKKARSLRLLSGGEKALTAIALMFGIYMVRSSPFCVLDEIDAPLDDQNVGRFAQIIAEFKNTTQFILITHHKKTMANAEAIFGITMQEPGISQMLSVELKESYA
jgi:chromosome segregation protein